MQKQKITRRDIAYILIALTLFGLGFHALLGYAGQAGIKLRQFIEDPVNMSAINQSLLVVPQRAEAKEIVKVYLGSKEWIKSEWVKAGMWEQAYSVINCESRFDPWSIGDEGNSRGLYQIHKKYHPEVSNECAFSPVCSTEWTIKYVEKNGWKAWTCGRLLGFN